MSAPFMVAFTLRRRHRRLNTCSYGTRTTCLFSRIPMEVRHLIDAAARRVITTHE